ncbi:MAG: hypothetical protein M3232_01390, partial [Thermoproteota archaeon]|nr:hypothetical protein [Thermoproteota archaeon]
FEVVKKFSDAGVCCGVNIDPIMPLITDSDQEIEAVVRTCKDAGLRHVFGALLRLREDIWQRVKLMLRLLETPDGINGYKEIYGIDERSDSSYITANSIYAKKITSRLQRIVNNHKMTTHFPEYMCPRRIDRSWLGQTTLQSYLV